MWSSSYLLLSSEQLLDEVHGALGHRRQVQLALLAQDVVEVELALHCALELAARHGHLLRSVVSTIAHASHASTSGVPEVLTHVVVDELVRVSLPEFELSLWEPLLLHLSRPILVRVAQLLGQLHLALVVEVLLQLLLLPELLLVPLLLELLHRYAMVHIVFLLLIMIPPPLAQVQGESLASSLEVELLCVVLAGEVSAVNSNLRTVRALVSLLRGIPLLLLLEHLSTPHLLRRVAADADPGGEDGLSDVDLRIAEALLAWVWVERGRDERGLDLALLEEAGVVLLHLLLQPLLILHPVLLLQRLLPLEPLLLDSIMASGLGEPLLKD